MAMAFAGLVKLRYDHHVRLSWMTKRSPEIAKAARGNEEIVYAFRNGHTALLCVTRKESTPAGVA